MLQDRSGGGLDELDTVAQQFYDYRLQHRSNDITALRPYLSDGLVKLLTDASRDPQHNALLKSDPFSSRTTLPDSSASSISARPADEHVTASVPVVTLV